jgi:hypothetical protein
MAMDSVWVEAPGTNVLSMTWDPDETTLCTDPGFELYIWYRNGIVEDTTTAACIEQVPYGLWQVIATPAQGCASSSLDTLLCPIVSLAHEGGLLLTDPGLGTYTWTYNGVELDGAAGPFLEVQGDGDYSVSISTDYGCVVSASIVVVAISVGVEPNPGNSPVFRIHPIPSEGLFSVEVTGLWGTSAMLRILDFSGRIVYERQETLAEGGLRRAVILNTAPGTYVVQVDDGTRRLVQRIVLQ